MKKKKWKGRPCCAPTVHINIMLNVIYNCIADLIRVFNFFNLTIERSLGIYYLNMQCFSS